LNLRTGEEIPDDDDSESDLNTQLKKIPMLEIRQKARQVLLDPPDARGPRPANDAKNALQSYLATQSDPALVAALHWGLRNGQGQPWVLLDILEKAPDPGRIPELIRMCRDEMFSYKDVVRYLRAMRGPVAFDALLEAFLALKQSAKELPADCYFAEGEDPDDMVAAHSLA